MTARMTEWLQSMPGVESGDTTEDELLEAMIFVGRELVADGLKLSRLRVHVTVSNGDERVLDARNLDL